MLGGDGSSATSAHAQAFAPRSGGDSGAEKTTTLMLPSSADTMRAFTSVLFSDMLLIEFTRTYGRGRWVAGV